MKNILVYINPRKDFDAEHHRLVRIQIDNCYRLGWAASDVILITNFPFRYNGIQAVEVPDTTHCEVKDQTSKITALCYLLNRNYFDDVCWFHDFDAFQVAEITKSDIGLGRGVDAAFTDYGWSKKWNTGSFFFTPVSWYIFAWLETTIYLNKTDEEDALTFLTEMNKNGINDCIKRLNVTYNIGMKRVEQNVELADKPIRVLHFHPGKRNLLEVFRPYMPEGLAKVMAYHGYR